MNRLLIFLLLCGTVQARQVSLTSAMLPYSSMQSGDTLTISGTKITTTGRCLTFSLKSNVYCDFGTDTIQFGTDNGSDVDQIYVNNCSNITFKGGVLLRNQGVGTNNIDYATYGVQNTNVHLVSGCQNILFDSTTMIVDGHEGHCVVIGDYSDNYRLDFNRCRFTLLSTGFDSRMMYDGAALKVNNMSSVADSFNFRLRNSVVTVAPQNAVAYGRGRIHIWGCSLMVDAQNTRWDPLYLDQGIQSPDALSADNCFIIICWGKGTEGGNAGTTIHDNVLIALDNHQGARGIMCDNESGTAANPVTIYNNTIDVHSGPQGNDPVDGNSKGIRVRSIDNNGISAYINIYKNTVYVTSDTNKSTKHIGTDADCIQWECYASGSTRTDHIRVDSNTVYARSKTLGTSTRALEFGSSSVMDTAGMSCSYNVAYSSGMVVSGRDWRNGTLAAKDFTLRNNTFALLPTADSFIQAHPVTISLGQSGYTGTGNRFIDNTYSGGAAYSDVEHYSTSDVLHMRTLNIYVLGGLNGRMVSGATVAVTNAYGQAVGSGTTDATGLFQCTVPYAWYSYSVADSLSYNNHVLVGSYAGDIGSAALAVSPTAYTDTITLANTNGGVIVTPTSTVTKTFEGSIIFTGNVVVP